MDAEGLLERITDDLLYHGDINAALRRLMQGGFDDESGQRVDGIRDLLDRLRQAREERLEQGDLGGVYDELAQELSEIVADEQQALADLAEQAAAADDERRREVVEQAAVENQMRLELLPNDLAGKVKTLQDYDFTSDDASQRFDDLVERLREQLAQSWFDQMSGSMEGMSPEDMARMKDMMAELNQMLEQRERGEEPDFEGFMERYGDFFPENPQTLDELLEIMAQRMAAMQAMLNSMTPEQRAQLQQLSEQLLEDMDLAFEADRLGQNLRQAFPQMGWDRSFDLSGSDPLDLAAAAKLFEELGELDQLEQMLRGVTQPGALAEVDTDRVRELLGADAAQSIDRLSELAQMLEDAGLVENKEGQLELTPRAIRRLGQQALVGVVRGAVPRPARGSRAGPFRCRATSGTSRPNPTSSAIRSISRSSARCATRSGVGPPRAATRADRSASTPTTSRSSAPSTWCVPARCCCWTCRCRCRSATTSFRRRRWRWRCTR